jgi:fucose permease
MTTAFAAPLAIHVTGLLVSALSGVAAYRDGIMLGLALIMVSDALLIWADHYERRNCTA